MVIAAKEFAIQCLALRKILQAMQKQNVSNYAQGTCHVDINVRSNVLNARLEINLVNKKSRSKCLSVCIIKISSARTNLHIDARNNVGRYLDADINAENTVQMIAMTQGSRVKSQL